MTQPLKPLKLLTINLKDESFHNSIEWSGLYLQVNIPPWLGKIFKFTVFRLLENAFCETPYPLVSSDHWCPSCRTIQSSFKFFPRNFPP